jgi:hypothetical protein
MHCVAYTRSRPESRRRSPVEGLHSQGERPHRHQPTRTESTLTAPESGLCIVPGCFEPHHARQFCDAHYQTWRRTGEPPLPEIKAERHREWLIRRELTLGFLPDWMESPFVSDDERRAAWERYGPELTAEDEAMATGNRPAARWRYVAGRPQYLGNRPSTREHDLTERTRWSHADEVEKFTFLAANGHLTPAERAWVAERGREARKRIGTPGEHKAALSPDYRADKEAVAIAEAVEASR